MDISAMRMTYCKSVYIPKSRQNMLPSFEVISFNIAYRHLIVS
jgi:hypothetical protein